MPDQAYEPIPCRFNPNKPGKKITSIYRGQFVQGRLLPARVDRRCQTRRTSQHRTAQQDAGRMRVSAVPPWWPIPATKDQVNLEQTMRTWTHSPGPAVQDLHGAEGQHRG